MNWVNIKGKRYNLDSLFAYEPTDDNDIMLHVPALGATDTNIEYFMERIPGKDKAEQQHILKFLDENTLGNNRLCNYKEEK